MQDPQGIMLLMLILGQMVIHIGKYHLSTKDYQNITLSSKQYSSATGPKDFKVQYSLDDSTWVDVPNGTVSTGSATWTTGGQLVDVTVTSRSR